jgi:lipoyl(octanoyl) transferase
MQNLIIRSFPSLQDYPHIWQQMQAFTENRNPETSDELWLLQHSPVFTQGLAGKAEHVLNPKEIPILQSDRGGQVTYHGPGQLIAYVLFDLNRLNIGTRKLVNKLEVSVIRLLSDYGIAALNKCEAPGVYVEAAKICSIGLRVRKGFSYHGLALNVDMNLEPFSRINPCGYQNLKMTQLSDFVPQINWVAIESKMIQYLAQEFGYNPVMSAKASIQENNTKCHPECSEGSVLRFFVEDSSE